mmetsp:Transcript_9751/g.17804  ORF Transcript_9751/g.17804 Transcript_9751/m.17804 type:complete len:185 (-) Transcript_9751:213-767(-)
MSSELKLKTQQQRWNERNDESSASLASTEVSSSSDDDEGQDYSGINSSPSCVRKSVSFSQVLSVRTHSLVVGDSPSCPVLPLSLDWQYNQDSLNLDEQEQLQQRKRRRRRNKQGAKKLLFYERHELLMDVADYSPKELMEIKGKALRRVKEEEEAAKLAAKRDGAEEEEEDAACTGAFAAVLAA